MIGTKELLICRAREQEMVRVRVFQSSLRVPDTTSRHNFPEAAKDCRGSYLSPRQLFQGIQ
jgi:hypothetical protein